MIAEIAATFRGGQAGAMKGASFRADGCHGIGGRDGRLTARWPARGDAGRWLRALERPWRTLAEPPRRASAPGKAASRPHPDA